MIDDTVREIQEMRTHSSSTVASNAARALHVLCDREYRSPEDFIQSLQQNSTILRQANISHASLQSTQRQIVDRVVAENPDTVESAKEALEVAIEEIVETIRKASDKAGKRAIELLSDGDVILTHDFSTTVVSVATHAIAAGWTHHVYVTEARPRFLGRRMARTLAGIDGIDVTLIVDSAAGHYLEECDRVLVGMDCIVDELLYNRVGTFPIATSASYLGVPMTVVGAASKVIDTGFVFENDFRSSVEVMREPTPEFSIGNPAYDATPIELLDSIVTEEGIETVE